VTGNYPSSPAEVSIRGLEWFLSAKSDDYNVFRSVKWVTQITNWRNYRQMNNIFSGMFTPPTLEQKRLSHVTLALFPFDVVILYLWNSRLKDVKRIVPEQTPCFIAKTLCCGTVFVNFQPIGYRRHNVWYHTSQRTFIFDLFAVLLLVWEQWTILDRRKLSYWLFEITCNKSSTPEEGVTQIREGDLRGICLHARCQRGTRGPAFWNRSTR